MIFTQHLTPLSSRNTLHPTHQIQSCWNVSNSSLLMGENLSLWIMRTSPKCIISSFLFIPIVAGWDILAFWIPCDGCWLWQRTGRENFQLHPQILTLMWKNHSIFKETAGLFSWFIWDTLIVIFRAFLFSTEFSFIAFKSFSSDLKWNIILLSC